MSHLKHQSSRFEAQNLGKRSRESKPLSRDEEMRDSEGGLQNGVSAKKARAKPPPLDILYEVRCTQAGRQDKSFFQEKPFAGTESTELQDYLQTSVMDVFIDVTGTDCTDKPGESRATFMLDSKREPFSLGKDFTVSRLTRPGMYIWSHHVQKMLRQIVKYYPGQILAGQRVFICHPYPVLHHFYQNIIEFMEECKNKTRDLGPQIVEQHSDRPYKVSKTSSGSAKPQDEQLPDYQAMAYDIGVLVRFLTPDHQSIIQPEMQRYARGVATYKMLWLLLKPGIDAYAKPGYGETLAGYVISSVEEARIPPTKYGPAQNCWIVSAWCLAYTGKHVFRRFHTISINEFKGEREITSLKIFPSSFYNDKDGQSLLQGLEKRGERYFEVIRNTPAHMIHSGYPFTGNGKKPYHGEVIIDPRNYPGTGSSGEVLDSDDEMEDTEAMEKAILKQREERSDSVEVSKWASYNDINPKKQSALTKHHYFLFTRRIYGFALKEKRWMSFDIERIRKLEWPADLDDAMSHLVLPRRDLDIIKALSQRHDRNKVSAPGIDFIQGKGEGQVFLLHGPPGTGKTLTVECIAEYTRRPLLALTVADIGTVESETEAHLSNWFALAANWGAVLLLDEADVFLERRKTSDLARNSMVSVFLRTMEYYTGILFLTTNRIGQIDDAFLSRVQVALGYEKLDDHAREQIWYGFFEKLRKDRKDVIVTERAKRFVTNDAVLKAMKWNGREIRNALQTAVSLAQNDADVIRKAGEKSTLIEVTADHLEQVVERRKVFIDYTNSIRRETEEQRALGEGSRRDRELG